jgi:hypothetical protein
MDGSAVSSQVVQDLEAGSRIVSIGYIGAVNCVGAISALPVVRGPAEFRCRSPSRRGCGGLLAWLFVSSSIGDKGDMDRDIEAAGLDTLQLDHLRHFNNLSLQPPKRGPGIGQDDFGGYRFQLAYMAYALVLTHILRLPAAPRSTTGCSRSWCYRKSGMYWHNVSRGWAGRNPRLKLPS